MKDTLYVYFSTYNEILVGNIKNKLHTHTYKHIQTHNESFSTNRHVGCFWVCFHTQNITVLIFLSRCVFFLIMHKCLDMKHLIGDIYLIS